MALDSRNKRAAAIDVALPWRDDGLDPAEGTGILDRAHKAHMARIAPISGVVFETLSLGVGATLVLSTELEAGATLSLGVTADFLPSLSVASYETLALDVVATDDYRATLHAAATLELDVEALLRFLPHRGVAGDLGGIRRSVLPGVGIGRRAQAGVAFARAATPGVSFELEVEPGSP